MSTNKNSKISGLIITLNEEKNIQSVIENLDFVDELIVVDSYSTDSTPEIVRQYEHVQFVQHPFENYSSQRNFALSLASNPWILFLDADERIPDKLKKEIQDTVSQKNTCDAYYFYRRFYFKDKPLRFSGWQTDKNIRLFKRDKAIYIPTRLVHEILKIEGKSGKLKNKLIHYSYADYESYKSKMDSYARLKARELYQKGIKPNLFHYYLKPFYKFFHSYFLRLGFLDGKKGLIICYLNALSVYLRYPYLKALYRSEKQ